MGRTLMHRLSTQYTSLSFPLLALKAPDVQWKLITFRLRTGRGVSSVGMVSAFATPVSLPLRGGERKSTSSRRPRATPSAYVDPVSSGRPTEPLPKATAPVPWLETALLTVFEPAAEPSVVTPPVREMSKWEMLWESLQALYALRLRPRRSRRVIPPSPPPSSEDGYLVEMPRFRAATGLDPHRCLSRAVVFIADLLADAVVFEILSRVNKPWDVIDTIIGVLGAYASADLVSGLYNWLRLNFSPNAAIFGEREDGSETSFSRMVAPHCAAVAPFFAMMLATPPGEIRGDAFVCYFLTFLSLLPAFREWSGGEKRPPKIVSLLQETGIVIKRSSTSSFHKLEYCIVCGLWDNLLTRIRLFSVLERWIYLHSGGRIRPRVWDIVPEARERACGPNDILLRKAKR